MRSAESPSWGCVALFPKWQSVGNVFKILSEPGSKLSGANLAGIPVRKCDYLPSVPEIFDEFIFRVPSGGRLFFASVGLEEIRTVVPDCFQFISGS